MKATLYDALGIPPTASDEEVRAGLRRLIRKYYARTRDGQGNVEEALRFINHASRILGDLDRRRRYDEELALSSGTTEAQIEHVVSNAVASDGEHTDIEEPSLDHPPVVEDYLDSQVEALKADAPERNLHHPGLTERVAVGGNSPLITAGLCLLFVGAIATAIFSVTPSDAADVGKQVIVWITVTLLALTVVYGIVHGISYGRRRLAGGDSGLVPQTDLAILNWRREQSVFLGTHQPAEDASWIFQLRMAELERAKAGRTSEPHPWHRLAARMFDYAIWGLLGALVVTELRRFGLVDAVTVSMLGHPLIAPLLITATFVPVEALLIGTLGATPGKWLFSIYLQFSISDAYARRDWRAQMQRAFRRAFGVWWRGMACGAPVLAPFTIAVAYEKVVRNQETEWDFAEDCLVTHGKAGRLNAFTGVGGIAAMLWLYGIAWHQPMSDALQWARLQVVDAIPDAPGATRGAPGLPRLAAPVPATLASASAPAPAPVPVPVQPTLPVTDMRPAPKVTSGAIPLADATPARPPAVLPASAGPSADPDVAKVFAERRARIDNLKAEGPRALRAGDFRRAGELCAAWADLELTSPEPHRCLGGALQGQGDYKGAIAAYKHAKQVDPKDPTIDAAIDGAQRGLVAQFQSRYRR